VDHGMYWSTEVQRSSVNAEHRQKASAGPHFNIRPNFGNYSV